MARLAAQDRRSKFPGPSHAAAPMRALRRKRFGSGAPGPRIAEHETEPLCLLGNARWVRLDGRWEQRLGWNGQVVHLLQPEDAALVTRHLESLKAENAELTGRPSAPVRPWLAWTVVRRGGQSYALARNVGEERRARRDRQELQRKLEHAQRHASIGLLASGVAHDFNNVLSTVLGSASLAMVELSDFSPNHPVHRELEAIVEAAQFAASLCAQLVTYAGDGARKRQAVDLSELLRSLSGLLAACAGRRAELRYSLAGGLSPVLADSTQISQVVMNLVMNAKDALGSLPGMVEIRTGQCWYGAQQLSVGHAGRAREPGEYVFIEVSDSGPGISPRVRDHLFDPFFSTKGDGRGLGLSATLGIVEAHGGAIALQTEVGRGTTFRVLFPAAP